MLSEVFIPNFKLFLLITARVLGMMTTAPVFAGISVPRRYKAMLAAFVSIASFPVIKQIAGEIPAEPFGFFVLIVENYAVGMVVGLFVYIIFIGFQFATRIFSIPMGLGMSEVVDPLSQVSAPAIGNFFLILSMLIYIHLNGPYNLIRGMVESFRVVWSLEFPKSIEVFARALTSSFNAMMMIGVKISLPIIGTLIAIDIALGILSRLAPQMNVMFIGFNIKVMLGIAFIWWGLPAVITFAQNIVETSLENAWHIIEFLH